MRQHPVVVAGLEGRKDDACRPSCEARKADEANVVLSVWDGKECRIHRAGKGALGGM